MFKKNEYTSSGSIGEQQDPKVVSTNFVLGPRNEAQNAEAQNAEKNLASSAELTPKNFTLPI